MTSAGSDKMQGQLILLLILVSFFLLAFAIFSLEEKEPISTSNLS